MNDLIDKRDERTRKRKAVKRKMDSVIGLSASEDKAKHHTISLATKPMTLSDKSIRLLDEGYIDNGFVIKKGTLEKFLNGQNQYVRGWEFNGEEWSQTEVLNLTDDFVGTVNIGHQEFASFPFLVGDWTRNDLSLVETENDRHGIDVRLNLDEESIFVKELQRKPYDIGVSAEFWYHVNEADTETLSDTLGVYMPVLDEIFIFAYGLVGECGNVNSSGLELKGEPMENIENIIETESLDEMEELGVEEVELPATEEEPTVEESSVVAEEEDNEPAEEEADEEAESEEESESEEAIVEEAEDEEGDEDGDEEAMDDDEEELSIVNDLKEQIQTLTNKINELAEANAKLKKTNRKLSSKYQNELDKKAKFKEDLKSISVELLPDEDKKPKEEKMKVTDKAYFHGDGIGEI